MQIESYRTRLEEFEQNLNRELYQYYSGLKDRLDLMVVYQEYSDLFSNESIREVKSELEKTGESFSSRRKSLKKIHDFLVDQHLDFRAARLTQEIARVDSQQKFQWEGKEIGLSQVPSLLKNEPDAARRRQLSDRFARILKETDARARHSIYRQFEEVVAREALVLPLFHEQIYRFSRPELEGLAVSYWQPTVTYENLVIRGQ